MNRWTQGPKYRTSRIVFVTLAIVAFFVLLYA